MNDNRELNAALEIHDSTLKSIDSSGDDVLAFFEAYVHRSAGRPGVDRGTGWSQLVCLRFRRGKATGNVATMPMKLLDGRLVLSKDTLSNLIPILLNHVGPCRLELGSSNEAKVVIEGEGVTCDALGAPVYVEEFEP